MFLLDVEKGYNFKSAQSWKLKKTDLMDFTILPI